MRSQPTCSKRQYLELGNESGLHRKSRSRKGRPRMSQPWLELAILGSQAVRVECGQLLLEHERAALGLSYAIST